MLMLNKNYLFLEYFNDSILHLKLNSGMSFVINDARSETF